MDQLYVIEDVENISSSPPPPTRQHGINYAQIKDRFELLIMSEAGKPIYSFSKREDAVTLMPLCSTLINYARKVQKETLMSMKTSDNLMISFAPRSPLIIIVIYEENSNVDPMILVDQVEAQVVSILTAKTLRSLFEERPTFDLKRLLYGSEKLIDSIANLSVSVQKLSWPWVQAFLAVTCPPLSLQQNNPNNSSTTQSSNSIPQNTSPYLPSRPHRILVPVASMSQSIRETLNNIILTTISANSKNIVFSLLFRIINSDGTNVGDEDFVGQVADEQQQQHLDEMVSSQHSQVDREQVSFKLITVCNHHNRHKLKIADIHIILALLDGSRAQLSSVESLWMPVCLPRFNQDAFLHSYITYINEMRNCLVILSVDRDEFPNCQKARDSIETKLGIILNDSSQKNKLYYQLGPLVPQVLLELQDKLVSNSLTEEELAEAKQQAQIYNSKAELYHARQLQFLWYQTNKQVLWWQRSPSKPLNSILFYVTKKMLQSSLKTLWLKLKDNTIFLGWHVQTFQLYAQFDSTITTNEAIEVIQRITAWIKKEEDNFSIKDYR